MTEWTDKAAHVNAARGPRSPDDLVTAEDFLAWCDEDTHAEWIGGTVQMMSPASTNHQLIVDFLIKVLGIYVEQRHLGTLISAPLRLRMGDNVREPDLMFVTTAHADRLRSTYLEAPADLVIEIVSPESVGRDRGEKWVEYAKAGIPEYWLIDPENRWAEFYRLEGTRYGTTLAAAAGVYESPVLAGFRLDIEWLWQEPLPLALNVLRELGVV